MDIEGFKRIEGFNSYYIDSKGTIISTGFKTLRTIKGKVDKDGYIEVGLYNNKGKRVHMRAHRLVGKHFVPNPNNFPIINHLNGVKDDNRAKNLEWTTNSGNMLHSFRVLGREPKATTNKPVTFRNKDTGEVTVFISRKEAADYFGYSQRQMGRLINGRADISKSRISNYEVIYAEEIK